MKIRTDFVTNSSSSSFIAFKFESKLLYDIVKKFKKEIKKQYSWCNISVAKNSVSFAADDLHTFVPNNATDALNAFLYLFYNSEKESLDKPETFGAKMAKEVLDNLDAILEDMKTANVTVSYIGWGGDDESRFYEDNYDKKYLDRLMKNIAKDNNVKVEEVTDEMFWEYVSSCTSIDKHTVQFNKIKNKLKKIETKNFYLE